MVERIWQWRLVSDELAKRSVGGPLCDPPTSVCSNSFRDGPKSQKENLAVKPSTRNCTFVDAAEANRLGNQTWPTGAHSDLGTSSH